MCYKAKDHLLIAETHLSIITNNEAPQFSFSMKPQHWPPWNPFASFSGVGFNSIPPIISKHFFIELSKYVSFSDTFDFFRNWL